MWHRTWQWACARKHIPAPGYRHVYDIGPLIRHCRARRDDGRYAAFVNSARNAAMKFADRMEIRAARTKLRHIRAPFMADLSDLHVSLKEITCRWIFRI